MWFAERLSERDWQIIEAVYHLRLVSGSQIERLYFSALAGHTRSVVRGRVLQRLVAWKMLTLLPRRIGGTARGSSGSLFALGITGARFWAERQAKATSRNSRRYPGLPTERTVRHTLAVSEVFVGLMEQVRAHGVQFVAFATEPACWWPNGLGSFLKPDAYACLAVGNVREHWWIEADLGTESLPTVKRKLLVYLNFVERGQLGPGNVVPRVLICAHTPARCAALGSVVSQLPAPAGEMFVVKHAEQAAVYMTQSIVA